MKEEADVTLSHDSGGGFVSKLLGWLDLSYCFFVALVDALELFLPNSAKKFRFFSKGWGNLSLTGKTLDKAMYNLQNKDRFLHLSHIKWDDPKIFRPFCGSICRNGRAVALIVKVGRFESPIASLLPDESKQCVFHWVQPLISGAPKQVVIMFPGTAEMGIVERLPMAKKLAVDYDMTSILIEAPYYGIRKPNDQTLWFLNTVADSFVQGHAIAFEGAALAMYCLDQSPETQVCLTGFSWGAATAASVSQVVRLAGGDVSRIACVPYVGCGTGDPIQSGMLARSVHWNALYPGVNDEGDLPCNDSTNQRIHNAKKELNSWQEKFDFTALLDTCQKQAQRAEQQQHSSSKADDKRIGIMRVVATQNDHFIPKRFLEHFSAQLEAIMADDPSTSDQAAIDDCPPRFQVRWSRGGHLYAALSRYKYQRESVIEAMTALKAIHKNRIDKINACI